MKLSYRGVKHDTEIPAIATTEGKVIGKYRGVELHAQETKINKIK